MRADATPEIPADVVAQFEADGVVVLRAAFASEWIELLRAAVERNLKEGGGPLAQEFARSEKSGRFHGDLYMWLHDETFAAFIFASPAARIVASLLSTKKLNFFYDQLLVKEPGAVEETPWHHDLSYWPIAGKQIASLWLALDPVTVESGGVRYVRGSHRWGKLYRAQSFTGDERFFDPELDPVPDVDTVCGERDLLAWDLEPGDCIVHHALTIHGAGGNRTNDRRRRALATRWAGDDAHFHPRVAAAPLPRDPGLSPGDPLDCELFPRVLPRSTS